MAYGTDQQYCVYTGSYNTQLQKISHKYRNYYLAQCEVGIMHL